MSTATTANATTAPTEFLRGDWRIVPGVGVNSGWRWHLEDIEFVEVAIELCDGRLSDLERQRTQLEGGRFCPWGARVLAIIN